MAEYRKPLDVEARAFAAPNFDETIIQLDVSQTDVYYIKQIEVVLGPNCFIVAKYGIVIDDVLTGQTGAFDCLQRYGTMINASNSIWTRVQNNSTTQSELCTFRVVGYSVAK